MEPMGGAGSPQQFRPSSICCVSAFSEMPDTAKDIPRTLRPSTLQEPYTAVENPVQP